MAWSLTDADLPVAVSFFVVAAVIIALVSPQLARTTDALGERTRFGSTMAGSVLLGASTSLPGILVTIVATLRGDVALAAANAIGGIAAQTTFLAVADVAYPKADLFRSSVSPKSLTQLGVLLVLLAIPMLAIAGYPRVSVGRVSPASVALVVVYLLGLWMVRGEPERATRRAGSGAGRRPLSRIWLEYALLVAAVTVSGYVIGTAISPISEALGLTSIAAGALLTATATSPPELITAVTAARRDNLPMAVGDIVGGNTFDMLFLVVIDLILGTSLYGKLGDNLVLLFAVTILLNALLLLGFARSRGGKRVSPESGLILAVYAALAVLLVTAAPHTGA